MSGLIWFIIMIYIVTRSIENAKKNSREQTKPNVQRPVPPRPAMPPQQPRTSQPQPSGGMWSAGQQQSSVQKAQKKQQKHQQRPVPAQPYRYQQMPQENTILQKAKANTTEHFDDNLTLSAQPQAVVREEFDTSQLMEQVNDLMVKGYSGNLAFERDFLAEATDMLNRMYG